MHLKACRVWRIRQAFFYPYPARHSPVSRHLREEKGTLLQTVWVDFQYGNRGGWPMMYRDIHVARLDSFRYTDCFLGWQRRDINVAVRGYFVNNPNPRNLRKSQKRIKTLTSIKKCCILYTH